MKEVIASANFEKTRKHGGIKTGYEEGEEENLITFVLIKMQSASDCRRMQNWRAEATQPCQYQADEEPETINNRRNRCPA